MSEDTIRWRYGARLRHGARWIWPRACWEYDIEKAKAKALRTYPHSAVVGVEPEPPEVGARWIHEVSQGWHLEAAPAPIEKPPAHSGSSPRLWWTDRD